MNRLDLYQEIRENVLIPPFTTDSSIAKVWLEEGKTVVIKRLSKISPVQILKCADDLLKFSDNNLYIYTEYTPKKEEFVVYVKDKSVFLVHEVVTKKWPRLIRNRYSGYSRKIVPLSRYKHIPDDIFISAKKVAEILGKDVEITVLWNPFRKKAYVLGATDIIELEEDQKKTVDKTKVSTTKPSLSYVSYGNTSLDDLFDDDPLDIAFEQNSSATAEEQEQIPDTESVSAYEWKVDIKTGDLYLAKTETKTEAEF